MMQEVRCKKCGELLYKTFAVEDGTLTFDKKVCLKSCEYTSERKITKIEIKCPRCGGMNVRKENVKDGENRNDYSKSIRA